jgi:DNA-binding YbaB/EbfC family protein
MNIQAIMKQAQKVQKDIENAKKEIDNMIFASTKGFVKIEMTGNKVVKKVEIDKSKIDIEDIELLEDMILIAINETIEQIEKETEKRLGKFAQLAPGMF